MMMKLNDLSALVINRSLYIHRQLGPGLLESIYEEILSYELHKVGCKVKRQVMIPVFWDGMVLDKGFRADIILEDKLLVEIKSVETVMPVHHKQVLTYLKLTDLQVGLLINFNEELLKHGLKRIVNEYVED